MNIIVSGNKESGNKESGNKESGNKEGVRRVEGWQYIDDRLRSRIEGGTCSLNGARRWTRKMKGEKVKSDMTQGIEKKGIHT